jgi:hypothetical protein
MQPHCSQEWMGDRDDEWGDFSGGGDGAVGTTSASSDHTESKGVSLAKNFAKKTKLDEVVDIPTGLREARQHSPENVRSRRAKEHRCLDEGRTVASVKRGG